MPTRRQELQVMMAELDKHNSRIDRHKLDNPYGTPHPANIRLTTLMLHAKNGEVEQVKKILAEDPKQIEVRGPNAYSILMFAAEFSQVEVAKILITAGINVNLASLWGESALSMAAYHGCVDIVKLLIDAGANVDHHDYYGLTPLMQAAYMGHLHACNALLDAGADILKKDVYGSTARDLARKNGYLNLEQYLSLAVEHAEKTRAESPKRPSQASARKRRQRIDLLSREQVIERQIAKERFAKEKAALDREEQRLNELVDEELKAQRAAELHQARARLQLQQQQQDNEHQHQHQHEEEASATTTTATSAATDSTPTPSVPSASRHVEESEESEESEEREEREENLFAAAAAPQQQSPQPLQPELKLSPEEVEDLMNTADEDDDAAVLPTADQMRAKQEEYMALALEQLSADQDAQDEIRQRQQREKLAMAIASGRAAAAADAADGKSTGAGAGSDPTAPEMNELTMDAVTQRVNQVAASIAVPGSTGTDTATIASTASTASTPVDAPAPDTTTTALTPRVSELSGPAKHHVLNAAAAVMGVPTPEEMARAEVAQQRAAKRQQYIAQQAQRLGFDPNGYRLPDGTELDDEQRAALIAAAKEVEDFRKQQQPAAEKWMRQKEQLDAARAQASSSSSSLSSASSSSSPAPKRTRRALKKNKAQFAQLARGIVDPQSFLPLNHSGEHADIDPLLLTGNDDADNLLLTAMAVRKYRAAQQWKALRENQKATEETAST